MDICKLCTIMSTFLLIQNHFRKKKMSLKEIPYTALGFFLLIQKISVCLYCLAEMKTQICEYWKQFF